MLPRAHRITSGDDYRLVVRRGARSGTRGMTVSVLRRDDVASPTRFGFIISKRVGVAVVRNRLRRRLKAVSRELLERIPSGYDVVYRLHPESTEWSFDELRAAARDAVRHGVRKSERAAAPRSTAAVTA